MKEVSQSPKLQHLLRGEMLSYRMRQRRPEEARIGLDPDSFDDPSLISEVRSSLINAGLKEVEAGTTEDSTFIKTEDWHIRVLHQGNAENLALVSHKALESIIITTVSVSDKKSGPITHTFPFFSDSDVLDINDMIESGDIEDEQLDETRNILEYKSTEIPPCQEDEEESSPIILCLGELHLRRQEAKKSQA